MNSGTLAAPIALRAGLVATLLATTTAATAQQYPIEWVTIGDTGNPAYDDPFNGLVDGRGSIEYEYRIGKYEVTTGQWMEFVNTFSTQSDDLSFFGRPAHWGAETDPTYNGPGRRWRIDADRPDAAMIPVHGIDWRIAAQFCNWLHNDRSSDLSSIEDGAYDASTFTVNGDGTFNDQVTNHPDARYWIPTLDEWVKAAHYDPHRYGQGEGGWWDYADSSDSPLVPGFPGEGDTSGTLDRDGQDIPLGAYDHARSPWGLFDLSGGVTEWTEEVHNSRRSRWVDGAGVFRRESWLLVDRVDQMGTEAPWADGGHTGLRLVAVVPAPSTLIAVMLSSCVLTARPRRR